jgi:hypothetical protein
MRKVFQITQLNHPLHFTLLWSYHRNLLNYFVVLLILVIICEVTQKCCLVGNLYARYHLL